MAISSELIIRRQKRRYYLTSLVTLGAVLVIAIFATLIAYRLPWKYDMTASKVFTLSEQSFQVLRSLTAPVQIISVNPQDAADPMVTSLLAEYAKAGPQIDLRNVDAERDPTLLSQYTAGLSAVTNGTIIVKSGTQTKLLYTTDMFPVSVDGMAFMGEAQITGAIRYVTTSEMPVVYFLEGHDETPLTGALAPARTALELNVYNVQTVNLLKAGRVPDNASLLVVASPRKDLSADEFQMLDDYMQKGGKALFLVDAMSTNTMVLDKFNNLLHEFGIDITNNLVVEEDANSHVGNNNLVIIPGYAQHSITRKLAESQRYTVLPIVMGLHTLDYDPAQVKLEPLLATTPRSWMRVDMGITSTSKTQNDVPGPLPVAYAATRNGSGYGNGDARVVVIGNSTFIGKDNIDAYGNRDFFLSCVSWLAGGAGIESISPKIISADRLIVRGTDFIVLLVLAVIVLPLAPFTAAFLTWYRRRNR